MEKLKNSRQKTPLVTHIFTADPSAHVFDGKIYIYPSHDLDLDVPDDENGEQYQMKDYHVLSMDDIGAPVTDCGCALHVDDVPWAKGQMWAPDAAYKNGRYYFYFPAKDKDGIFRIGAATGDNPEGPFKAEPDYIPGTFSIDPAIFVDCDGRAYIYLGGIWGGQLEKWRTGVFDPNAPHQNPKGDSLDNDPAIGVYISELNDDMLTLKEPLREVKILGEDNKPLTVADTDKRFFEAPWMHKYNNKYYLSYSTGETHYLCYAESESPTGPFKYKGRILEPVKGWTTHQSIIEFKNKWYLFYHDAAISGISHQRNVMFRELEIGEDGTIKTINPYDGD
ncbi:MAG: glycoside hydrolase family 43 protein [Oscillospiraceae bacterium]|nr:glycoside hydrolase family 43 protein [Oscillospiraceae bacterium]